MFEREMISATGRVIDIANLTEEDIELYHIAHSLATKTRFNGSAREPYPIAQHCCLAAMYTEPGLMSYRAIALLHDASEAYLVDVPRGLKLLPEFKPLIELEHRIELLIFHKYVPSSEQFENIRNRYKPIDNELLNHEARALCNNWGVLECTQGPVAHNIFIEPWTWQEAERTFLALAAVLGIKD